MRSPGAARRSRTWKLSVGEWAISDDAGTACHDSLLQGQASRASLERRSSYAPIAPRDGTSVLYAADIAARAPWDRPSNRVARLFDDILAILRWSCGRLGVS